MKNSVLYVIIAVLLVLVVSGVTYIVMDNKDNDVLYMNKEENNNVDNNKEEVVLKDGVELVDTYKENDKIIQEFKVVLNNKERKMKVIYEYSFSEGFGHLIYATINDSLFFSTEYFDEVDNTKDNIFNIVNVDTLFNENSFEIIKGVDNKNYLGVFTEDYGYMHFKTLNIFNDELEIINKNFNYYGTEASEEDDKNGMVVIGYTGFSIEPNKWAGYDEESDIEGCYPLLKIETNKIYYLMPIFGLVDEEYGILEERIYTINNNKLEYIVKSRNKIIDISGQIP